MMQRPLRIPLFGQMSSRQLHDALNRSLTDEATAADFYTRLLQIAPAGDRAFITEARDDELFHLHNFQNLYEQLFGSRPPVSISPTPFSDYRQGLMTALTGELDAAGFYRDVQLSNKDPVVVDLFYLAMVDELEHATRFSTLYNLR
jgi:rubrerythrin